MDSAENITKLLLFLVEQKDIKPKIINHEVVLQGNGLYVQMDFLQGALKLCKITIGSQPDDKKKSVFFEAHTNIASFMKRFYERAQETLFIDGPSDYIRSNGSKLKQGFLVDIQEIHDDFDSWLDNQGRFQGQLQEQQGLYFVEFSGIDLSNPSGILQLCYKEQEKVQHETFFLFNPEDVSQYPLIRHMAEKDLKRSIKNHLPHMCNPLVNYFLLQEKMSGLSVSEGARKNKL